MKKMNLLYFLLILALCTGAKSFALIVTLHNKSDRDIYFNYTTCWKASNEESNRRWGEEGFTAKDCIFVLLDAPCTACKRGKELIPLKKRTSYTINHASSWVNKISFYDAEKKPDSTIKFYGNDGKPMPETLESLFYNYEYTFR